MGKYIVDIHGDIEGDYAIIEKFEEPKMKSLESIISETLEEVKIQMCEDFCRYPLEWNEEEQGVELCESEHCQNCPLNRL